METKFKIVKFTKKDNSFLKDCSKVGIVRILMIQTIEEEIKERGDYNGWVYM
jgi:hypothetical protein